MAMLRGAECKKEGDFYYYGDRKWHKEALPRTLKAEIDNALNKEAAVTASKTTKGKRRAKQPNASPESDYGVSATAKQPRQRKN